MKRRQWEIFTGAILLAMGVAGGVLASAVGLSDGAIAVMLAAGAFTAGTGLLILQHEPR